MQATDTTALQLFESGLTKSEITKMANEAVTNVLENGEVLKVAEALAAMENFIKEVKADKRFKEYTREETTKYPKGFVSNSGAKIEVCETGTSYDFAGCNDEVLNCLDEMYLKAEARLKERKEFLKKLPSSGLEMISPEGVVVTIYPPSKTSTSSYKVTLSK